ncbi:MAG: hypothetical protein HC912_06185 [Saprospiraceae bacterium]|nr:hypothetical protein [Saprospiraceae bacterium]
MRKTNVLIVGDNQDFAERIGNILKNIGCHFLTLRNREALQFQESEDGLAKEDFDVVIMPLEASKNHALVDAFKHSQLPIFFFLTIPLPTN